MANMYKGIPFSPQVALADSIGASDTVIKVTDITAFPDAPNYATIGTDETGETILYAAKTGDSLSGCTRGIEGEAKSWPAGTTIARNFTNKDFEAMQENIRNNQTAVGNAQTTADNAVTAAGNAAKAAGDAQTTADNAAKAAGDAQTTADNAAKAAGDAATAAGNAQTAAENVRKDALLKSGGAMTGPLLIPAPVENAHAANKEYVDTKSVSATLYSSGWTPDETSGFIQTIEVAGLTDDKKAKAYPARLDTLAEKLALREETAKVCASSRSGSSMTFECWEETPALDIPIIVEVYV